MRETIQWLRARYCVRVPQDTRELVELATHADHLQARANVYGARWEALWQRLYGRGLSERQAALGMLVDRSQDYAQALVDGRAPTRLGDGTVDVDVHGALASAFTGNSIVVLAVPARWLRNAKPGSPAVVQAPADAERTVLNIDRVRVVYSREGLQKI